jgi:hypothetical protein
MAVAADGAGRHHRLVHQVWVAIGERLIAWGMLLKTQTTPAKASH